MCARNIRDNSVTLSAKPTRIKSCWIVHVRALVRLLRVRRIMQMDVIEFMGPMVAAECARDRVNIGCIGNVAKLDCQSDTRDFFGTCVNLTSSSSREDSLTDSSLVRDGFFHVVVCGEACRWISGVGTRVRDVRPEDPPGARVK